MSNTTRKNKIFRHECRICGSPAEYSYFGAIACQSCKIFFRRNAQKKKEFLCDFDGQCEINVNSRNTCRSCRLAKCFKSGMITDKIRGPIQKKPQTKCLVKSQVQSQPVTLPTLNLLRSDQSLLTHDQWTLLTNLFYCYKESQVFPFIQRLNDINRDKQSTYLIYSSLVEEFLVSIYETAGNYLYSNDDLRHLSFDDRSIILRNSADNVCCIGGAFVMQNCLLYGLETFLEVMNIKYGKRTMDIHISARKFITSDITLIKLGISLFAFSENTSSYYLNISQDLTNPIKILEIQNKYAEITWKYLLYRYGQYDAVKKFLNLTLWLISINTLAFHAQSLAVHVSDIHSIVEQTELKLILDDVDEIIQQN